MQKATRRREEEEVAAEEEWWKSQSAAALKQRARDKAAQQQRPEQGAQQLKKASTGDAALRPDALEAAGEGQPRTGAAWEQDKENAPERRPKRASEVERMNETAAQAAAKTTKEDAAVIFQRRYRGKAAQQEQAAKRTELEKQKRLQDIADLMQRRARSKYEEERSQRHEAAGRAGKAPKPTSLAETLAVDASKVDVHINKIVNEAARRVRRDGIVPSTLIVSHFGQCHLGYTGFFQLVPGETPNGYPLWQLRGRQIWLFTGSNGRWIVGGMYEKTLKFQCKTGLFASPYPHEGAMPHTFPAGCWQRYRGGSDGDSSQRTAGANRAERQWEMEEDFCVSMRSRPVALALEVRGAGQGRRTENYDGRYDLCANSWKNGFPLWQREDGDYWIFAGTDGHWLLGGEREFMMNFECTKGALKSCRPHAGRMPDELEADASGYIWSVRSFAVGEFKADKRVKVEAQPEAAGSELATAAAEPMQLRLQHLLEDGNLDTQGALQLWQLCSVMAEKERREAAALDEPRASEDEAADTLGRSTSASPRRRGRESLGSTSRPPSSSPSRKGKASEEPKVNFHYGEGWASSIGGLHFPLGRGAWPAQPKRASDRGLEAALLARRGGGGQRVTEPSGPAAGQAAWSAEALSNAAFPAVPPGHEAQQAESDDHAEDGAQWFDDLQKRSGTGLKSAELTRREFGSLLLESARQTRTLRDRSEMVATAVQDAARTNMQGPPKLRTQVAKRALQAAADSQAASRAAAGKSKTAVAKPVRRRRELQSEAARSAVFAAMAPATGKAPAHLYITSGVLRAVHGHYDLVPDMKRSGMPVWRQRHGPHSMYSSTGLRWTIGGADEQVADFVCASGFVAGSSRHGGLMPHVAGGAGQWLRWDGEDWQDDTSIVVDSGETDYSDIIRDLRKQREDLKLTQAEMDTVVYDLQKRARDTKYVLTDSADDREDAQRAAQTLQAEATLQMLPQMRNAIEAATSCAPASTG
eukprot:TRINITY_DN13877_c0_g1_i4.p1 TRINITY_DN13877_c0_g1~~TRINITY_DN13877_c0_g1_i4.p1  ORF type:complete len:983 (+),score=249.27 TRINITY_DN13877_c0_g1_i4:152-3100(+)